MAHPQSNDLTTADEGADWVNLHVCRRLKAKRILCHMSQERLAGHMGISYQQLQRYESGKSRLPCSLMYRAAVAMDVPVSYFFDTIQDNADDVKAIAADKATLRTVGAVQDIANTKLRHALLDLIGEISRGQDRAG